MLGRACSSCLLIRVGRSCRRLQATLKREGKPVVLCFLPHRRRTSLAFPNSSRSNKY